MRNIQKNSYARRIVLAGAVALTTITGSLGVAFQPAGATTAASATGTISTYATLPSPHDGYYSLTGDPSGNLYAVDENTCAVVKIDASTQASTTISTNPDWCSPNEEVYNLTYAVLNGTPTLVIADYGNSAIDEVPASGGQVVKVGYEYAPAGFAYDASTDTLYIADDGTGNAPLWKITSFSSCTHSSQCNATQITTTGLRNALGLFLKGSTLYTEAHGESSLLASVPTSGGTWTVNYDNVGSQDLYGNPSGDPWGNIYYVDFHNNALRILPAGQSSSSVLTLSGSPALYAPYAGPVYFNGALYLVSYDSATFDSSIVKITLPVPPNAPTNVTASAGNASATVSWTASSGATTYTVTASPGGATCAATAPATTCTVTGLTNGTAYTFTVTATNANGTSDPSTASTTVTPMAPANDASLAKTGAPLQSTIFLGFGALVLGAVLVSRRRRVIS